MSVYDEIALGISQMNPMRKTLAEGNKHAYKGKINPTKSQLDFIEISEEKPGKKHDEPSPGTGKGSYYKKSDPQNESWEYNRGWLETKIISFGSEALTDFLWKPLWDATKSTSERIVLQPGLFRKEDLFYFYAGVFQRLLDPKYKKYAKLDASTLGSPSISSVADNVRYDPLITMIPTAFEDYVTLGHEFGSYPGVFGLGPEKIYVTKHNYVVYVSNQIENSKVRTSWYDLMDHRSYSAGGGADGKDGLLKDELMSLKEIQGLFSLEMILNLRDDIENNKVLYKDYESQWLIPTFSIDTFLGPGARINYDQAYLFWTSFLDELEGIVSDEAGEEAVSAATEASDIFLFDPNACKVDITDPIPPECDPPCVPNPKGSSTIWQDLPDRQPFSNDEVCETWVSLTTQYTDALTKTTSEIINEYISEGIELILQGAGKSSDEATIISLASSTVTEFFMDFRNLSHAKVLVRIPYSATLPIEDKPPKTSSETTDSAEFSLNVVLDASDIRGTGSMLNLVSRAIGRKYAAQYEIAREMGQLSGLPQNILLGKEGSRIREFKKELIKLLKSQGFRFNPARKKIGTLEAVEIGFAENFTSVEYVKANNIGCEPVELTQQAGWNTFKSSAPATYPTTLAFVANAPPIFDAITSDSPPSVSDFLKQYFFPRPPARAGQDLELAESLTNEEGCTASDVAKHLTKPALILGSEVAGTILSYPELVVSTLGDTACLDLEGKKAQDEKFNALEEIEKRWKDVDLRRYFSGDGVLEDLPHKLDEITNLKELYGEIINKLGVCGISALVMDALGCLVKGLDLGDSMEGLVRSFITSATDKEMEKLYFRLNPALQQFIRDSVSELTSIPLPWEAGYREGSYKAAGATFSADYVSNGTSLDDRLAKTSSEADSYTTVTVDDELRMFRAKSKTTMEEQREKFSSFTPIPLTNTDGSPILDEDGNPIIITSPEGVTPAPGLGPRKFAGPFAHAGSVGTALDNIQDNAIRYLKEAIFKAIEENIISADAFIAAIDKIPGGSLVKNVITEVLDCPLPPLFSPPLDDILKTLELDFCDGHYAITLPVVPKMRTRPFMGDIKTVLIESAEEALERLVAQSVIAIIRKIIEVSLNATCEVITDTAGMIQDLAGGSSFREIVANNLCGDNLNEDALNASLNQLNDALGSLGLPGVPKPSDQEMGEFMDGISAILTQDELMGLLDGDPDARTVAYVRQVVGMIPSLSAALPSDLDIQNMFAGLGKVFDREAIRDKMPNSYRPVSPSVCASPQHLELFDELRCSILREKGLTPEQCEEQLTKLKEQTKKDFDDLADLLNENYFDVNVLGDPECSDSGIYAGEDPATKKQAQELFSSNYDVINATLLTELTSRRGLLNMILSDTRGTGYKKHNEFWVNFFGQSLSKDLGPFGFYIDAETGGSGSSAFVNLLGGPYGAYPDEVAPYLKGILGGSLAVNFVNDTIPNLTLAFDNWDKDFGAPDWLNVDYSYIAPSGHVQIGIYSDDDGFGDPIIFNTVPGISTATQEYIAALPPTPFTTPEASTFASLISTAWSPYTTNQLEGIEKHAYEILFPYLTSKSVEKMALKISSNVRAFNFGFNENAEYTTVNLDPAVYGGSEKNPYFYVKSPVHSGWVGLYDKIIPEVDGCTPNTIVNFNSISSQTADYNDKLPTDPRLEIPESCALDGERPYDRIMPKETLAGTDGAIQATVRLYILEAFLSGMPAFSLFQPSFPDVFNETLLNYIASTLKIGLLETGLNFRSKKSKERYYYTFLEEVVQNFGKKVDLGLISPSSQQIAAMEKINSVQSCWTNPKRGINYQKRRKEQYLNYLKATESSALILLQHYIREQFEEVAQLFKEIMAPSIPNLESWIFGSPTWMFAGAISAGGPLDVATDPSNLSDPTTAIIMGLTPTTLSHTKSSEFGNGFFPFILEKYIKVTPQGDFFGAGSEPQIFGLEWWRTYLDAGYGVPTTGSPITENYKEWSYGIRISILLPEDINTGGSTGLKSKADFDNSISAASVGRIKSLKFGPDLASRRYVVPVASAEVPIPGDTILESSLIDAYDINCMIGELIQTPEYETLFKYSLPLQTLLSLITIYCIETFTLSIGQEWKKPGGTPGSQFRRWDKTANFKKTKKNLRRLFESFYHARDASYEDEEEESEEEKTLKKVRVKKKLPNSTDIKWWKKRKQVPKPADECEEE